MKRFLIAVMAMVIVMLAGVAMAEEQSQGLYVPVLCSCECNNTVELPGWYKGVVRGNPFCGRIVVLPQGFLANRADGITFYLYEFPKSMKQVENCVIYQN